MHSDATWLAPWHIQKNKAQEIICKISSDVLQKWSPTRWCANDYPPTSQDLSLNCNSSHPHHFTCPWSRCPSIISHGNPIYNHHLLCGAWWRHQVETFSALLAFCVGNSPVTGEFPAQRPVTRSFDVFFDLRLNKQLSKQSWGWWFETPSRPLWRQYNGTFKLVGRLYPTRLTFEYSFSYTTSILTRWCNMSILVQVKGSHRTGVKKLLEPKFDEAICRH